VAASLAGCGPNISTVRVGGLYPAKDKSCDIPFVKSNAGYEMIGLVTVSNHAELGDKIRRAVQERACVLGGDAIGLNASVDPGSALAGQMTQFVVLHRPEPEPQR
jgi:hypothetical protein